MAVLHQVSVNAVIWASKLVVRDFAIPNYPEHPETLLGFPRLFNGKFRD
jgi:hypothetical protein